MTQPRAKVTLETPVPLLIESLTGNPGWEFLKLRLLDVRDGYNRLNMTQQATTDPREVQRNIGIMIGLNRILQDPDLLEREWRAIRKKEEERVQRQRLARANETLPGYEHL